MIPFAGPGLGWGSRGEEWICLGFFLLLVVGAIAAFTVMVHRWIYDLAKEAKEAKKAKERATITEHSVEYLRAQLSKLSDEQRDAIRRLFKSGRTTDAILEAGRTLGVSAREAELLADELQE